jgi:hypothetical protein
VLSSAVRAHLEAAEMLLAEGSQDHRPKRPTRGSPERLSAGLGDRYRALVEDLATSLQSTNAARARMALRNLLREIRIEIDEHEIRFVAQGAEKQTELPRVSGAPLQLNVVAGAH